MPLHFQYKKTANSSSLLSLIPNVLRDSFVISCSYYSSSRAHEPNTQSFSTLCALATAYISSRFARPYAPRSAPAGHRTDRLRRNHGQTDRHGRTRTGNRLRALFSTREPVLRLVSHTQRKISTVPAGKAKRSSRPVLTSVHGERSSLTSVGVPSSEPSPVTLKSV